MPKPTYSILIKGRVQGIGFRPYIYLLAKKLKINGYVKNTKQGVLIHCQGKNCKKFIQSIKTNPPQLSQITEIFINKIQTEKLLGFEIRKSIDSLNRSDAVQIMPDMAVCKDCAKEIEDKYNRRYFYPFTNCTQCGPRYSIIYSVPYDRPNTTMKEFNMCSDCLKEYQNPIDRRFHAQPNACPICGPKLTLLKDYKPILLTNDLEIIRRTKELLAQGDIIAIKSIGGFLLACDACNEKAIAKLRVRKKRKYKPLAIMAKDIKSVAKICKINKKEKEILKSRISPIVLLRKKAGKGTIYDKIAPKNGCLGVMLPYTPLHRLLFSVLVNVSRETIKKNPQLSTPFLVMTSANPKSEPICADLDHLRAKMSNVVDYILDHNRPIESRCDDSIVFNYKGPVIIRRSRGYVPEPIFLKNMRLKPVLAFGSDYKNHFALGQDNRVYLSPYIGDLTSHESINFFFEMLEKYQKWFRIKPEIVACDLHPDYFSSRLAEQYANSHRVELIKIQHHYAHLAGVMAEHNLVPPVIGIGFDGTGYGADGKIWGSEIMVLDYNRFERTSLLKEMPLVGGDIEVTNPKMIADAYLNHLNITTNYKFNVQTTSMGRLFDAVSSILGICHKQTFEGEAPIALEAEAMKKLKGTKVQGSKVKDLMFVKNGIIDPGLILHELLSLKQRGVSISEIALYLHQIIIGCTIEIVKKLGADKNIHSVVLSGGVFQNRIILDGIFSGLTRKGFSVYLNRQLPINDGGISFGQAVLAGAKLI